MKPLIPFGVNFYIRQNKNRKKNHNVYCCIKAGETPPREMCVARNIRKSDWNCGKGKPKQTSESLVKLSLYLSDIRSKLFNIYFDASRNREFLSAERIKNIYLNKEDVHCTLLQVMDLAIKKYDRELEKGSMKNYGTTQKYVKAFCASKYKRADIPLKYLTHSFIEELKTYILFHPLKPNDPCTNNGCMKHLERIKKIMTWAYEVYRQEYF